MEPLRVLLENALEYSMAMNLTLTGLLATLASLPHAGIHAWMYHNVLSSLSKVWRRGKHRLTLINDGPAQLEWCRNETYRDSTEGIREYINTASHATVVSTVVSTSSERAFLTAFVVLEGFIVELAAILLTKQQLELMPVYPEGHYMHSSGKKHCEDNENNDMDVDDGAVDENEAEVMTMISSLQVETREGECTTETE